MARLMSHDHLVFTIGCVIAAVDVGVILTSTRSALYYVFLPSRPSCEPFMWCVLSTEPEQCGKAQQWTVWQTAIGCCGPCYKTV